MREQLWSVVARRATAAAARQARPSGGAHRPAVRLVDSEGRLPEPGLGEQLAVTLADGLPGFLIAALGVRGLLVLGWLLAAPLLLAGRIIGVRPLRPATRPGASR